MGDMVLQKVEEMLPIRLSELQEIGLVGVPTSDGTLIELVNLSDRNINYINEHKNYGFKVDGGKFFMQTIFPDKPQGQTCWGLSFQPDSDLKLISNKSSRAKYLQNCEIYNQVSVIDKLKIKDIFSETMASFGYTDVEQIKDDISKENFDFAKELYNKFDMIDKIPQTVNDYNDNSGIVIYSGARDVGDKIERLKKGEYPFTNQSTFGFGYYFSDGLYTPRIYSNKVDENIIEARLDSSAKVINKRDLDCMIPMLFDDMQTSEKYGYIAEILQLPEFETLATRVVNCDCLQVASNYKVGETYYIPANLSSVVLSKEPLFTKSTDLDIEKGE